MSWVSIRRPCQQVSKEGSIKEYVNCVSIPEYGLDCQSRLSKSCVLNNGTLSTEVLRVAVGYRSTVICAPRHWSRPSVSLFRTSFTSKTKQTEQFTSCTSVLNSYSQYFSTQCPIVYYTLFTTHDLLCLL